MFPPLSALIPLLAVRPPAALIVEDDKNYSNMARDQLEENGWRVEQVWFADEVRPMLAREVFDLLIIDWVLDDVTGSGRQADGVALVQQLRAEGLTIPVLMMTTVPDGWAKAVKGGVQVYVRKPLIASELEGAVAGLMSAVERQTRLRIDKLDINFSTNTVSYDNTRIRLAQVEANTLAVLAIHHPDPVSKPQLHCQAGWHGEYYENTNAIPQAVARLRKSMDAAGLPPDLVRASRTSKGEGGWTLDRSKTMTPLGKVGK